MSTNWDLISSKEGQKLGFETLKLFEETNITTSDLASRSFLYSSGVPETTRTPKTPTFYDWKQIWRNPIFGTWISDSRALEPVLGTKFHVDFDFATKTTNFLQPQKTNLRTTKTMKFR